MIMWIPQFHDPAESLEEAHDERDPSNSTLFPSWAADAVRFERVGADSETSSLFLGSELAFSFFLMFPTRISPRLLPLVLFLVLS